MAALDKKLEPSQDSEVGFIVLKKLKQISDYIGNSNRGTCGIDHLQVNVAAVLSPNGIKVPKASSMYTWYCR